MRRSALALVLVLVGLLVPEPTIRRDVPVLVKVGTAEAVGHRANVIWVLALGSDLHAGGTLGARADAIQLVGLNLRTGSTAVIGIPRDSWVSIPGHGSDRINTALPYGGPALIARVVADLVGVAPDYVFSTGFSGFQNMVNAIGGVEVRSKVAFTDPEFPLTVRRGPNRFRGWDALSFARARVFLTGGDLDRSANQQSLLVAILRQVRLRSDDDGFMEQAVLAVLQNLNTDLSPAELYRLAQAATQILPGSFAGCVMQGRDGLVGEAQVLFPDVAQAARLGDDVRDDARFDGPC